MSHFLFQFLDSMFSQLFELLKEVQECDTKVIHVLCFQCIKPRCTFVYDSTLSSLHGRLFLCLRVPWVRGFGLEAWIYMYMYEV